MTLLSTFTLLFSAGGVCVAAPVFETTDVFLQGSDGYHSYRLPVSVATTDGTLLLFADGRKDSAADTNNKIDPVLRRSTDGGETWTEVQVLATDPGDKTKMGNCTAVYDAETDTVHLVYLKNLVQAFRISTTDGGETFTPPNEITSAYDEFAFPWEYFATGHVHGIQLESGRLMLPVWMSDHPRDQDGAAEFRVGVLYSDDHGATFHAGGTIVGPYDAMNETSIYEGSDGTVYANSRVSGLGYRAVSASGDAGMTWSTPAPDYELSDPTCQASTLVLPSADGVNRLLFCNPAGPDRTHLTVRMSYDDGATWPVSRLIDAGPSGYCDMAADQQGNIYVFYENNATSSVGNISMAKFNLDWLLEEEPSWRDGFGFDGVGVHLPFNNSAGGTFSDAAGKEITEATILGTVPVVYDTQRGTVASFDGNGANRVSLGDELDPLDAGYTVSLWFKADALEGTQFLASKGNQYSGYEGWSIFLARDDWLFVRGNHGADDDARLGVSREGITDDEWHHVALVIDNATGSWEAYFDGVSSGEDGNENGWMIGEGGGITADFSPGVAFDNQDELLLGAGENGSNPFSGLLDDFAVWGHALSEAEVLAIYQGGPISRIEGDINGDGLVGSGDLDAIRGDWGNLIEQEFAFVDCNHDGRVDSADLDVVRANWGEASATAVPEPSGIVLFFIVAAFMINCVRLSRMRRAMVFTSRTPKNLLTV